MQKELVILDDDKIYARKRVAELEKEIQDLGPEFYDVFNQSSETWHDNAPFDALRDRQSVLAAELQNLRTVLRNSAISAPKPKKNTVGIGSTVTLSTGKRYFIAGDWTPHAGQMKNDIMVISSGTPLAGALIGKKPGDEIAIGKVRAAIKEIS